MLNLHMEEEKKTGNGTVMNTGAACEEKELGSEVIEGILPNGGKYLWEKGGEGENWGVWSFAIGRLGG